MQRNYLSRERLLELTGAIDLATILFLELQVDNRTTGVGGLGKIVPNIRQLKLNNSYLPLVRDIGTGYHNLKILWMARCELADLDGISNLRNLKELYLAYNSISDLSALGLMEYLEILDLER